MKNKPNSLRRKRRIFSTEAALASLLIHGLLLFTAGTVVAVRYVQKNRAEITVQMEPPRLERRPVQTVDALEQIRRTARSPRIVSRAPSVSAPAFPLPDLDGITELDTQKIETPFAPGQDFRRLTWAIGVGAPSIRFLGVHDEAEKAVFVLDVSNGMQSPQTGGPAACRYILQQFGETLAELPSSVLFNVICYDHGESFRFREELVPVFEQNRADAVRWLDALLIRSERETPAVRDSRARPTQTLGTAVGGEPSGWLQALQLALEEGPETVFLVARSWGRHPISREKGRALLDFSLWEVLDKGGSASIGGSPVLEEDRALRDDLLKKAVESAEEEQERMEADGGAAPFVRDLIAHIQYSEQQLLDHADAVCRAVYAPRMQARPRIHAIRLVSEDEEGVSDDSTRGFRNLARHYDGHFMFLNGADAADRMDAAASVADAAPEDPEASGGIFEEARVDFFEMSAKGARIALILDLSDDLWSGESGAAAWPLIRRQLLGAVRELPPETGFYLVCGNGQTVTAHRTKMSAATDPAGMSAWLDAAFQGRQSEPPAFPGHAVKATPYPSALGADARGLLLSLQTAMEQQADVILAVSGRPGRQPVPREKAQRLLDFSIWSSLGASAGIEEEEDEEGETVVSGGSSGGDLTRSLRSDQQQLRALIRQAIERIEEEKEAREDSGLPQGFVHDITAYIEYTPGQITDHLRTVARKQYPADRDDGEMPSLYVVQITGDEEENADPDSLLLQTLQDVFEGEYKALPVTGDRKELLRLNRRLEL